jgi:hypothetical protein
MRKEDEMTIKGRMDHSTIFDTACFLKPIYDLQQDRYMAYLRAASLLQEAAPGEETSVAYAACVAAEDAWNKSVEAYHRALMKNASKLGKATRIGGASIKMLMGVRGTIIVWTPEWLRNVANYERINPNYWIHPQSRKLNQYEFPREISSQ